METDLYKSSLSRGERIGRGSYSVVFKGYRKDDASKTVAIKRIENDHDFFTENATKDIDALRSVTGHNNVVKLLDLHSDDEYIYIIMEYCEKGDLEDFLSNNNPPSYELKLEIMKQCARGVAYIHGLNPPVVHRDIKCNNILLQNTTAGVVVKIADFGLAKVLDKIDGDTNRFFMSTDAGSMAFRAPEMCTSGRKQYNASVDIYALGLVFTLLINYDDKDKLLEPHTANEPRDPYLPYGMRQLQAHTKKTPMPDLFFKPVVDEKYQQIKAIIIAMTRFDFNQRTDILLIKAQLKKECIEDVKRNAVAEYTEAMELMKSQHDKEMSDMNERFCILELEYNNEVQRRRALQSEFQKARKSQHHAQATEVFSEVTGEVTAGLNLNVLASLENKGVDVHKLLNNYRKKNNIRFTKGSNNEWKVIGTLKHLTELEQIVMAESNADIRVLATGLDDDVQDFLQKLFSKSTKRREHKAVENVKYKLSPFCAMWVKSWDRLKPFLDHVEVYLKNFTLDDDYDITIKYSSDDLANISEFKKIIKRLYDENLKMVREELQDPGSDKYDKGLLRTIHKKFKPLFAMILQNQHLFVELLDFDSEHQDFHKFIMQSEKEKYQDVAENGKQGKNHMYADVKDINKTDWGNLISDDSDDEDSNDNIGSATMTQFHKLSEMDINGGTKQQRERPRERIKVPDSSSRNSSSSETEMEVDVKPKRGGQSVATPMKYKHKRSAVIAEAIVGDFTKLNVGGVVNAANEDLNHYDGVAGYTPPFSKAVRSKGSKPKTSVVHRMSAADMTSGRGTGTKQNTSSIKGAADYTPAGARRNKPPFPLVSISPEYKKTFN